MVDNFNAAWHDTNDSPGFAKTNECAQIGKPEMQEKKSPPERMAAARLIFEHNVQHGARRASYTKQKMNVMESWPHVKPNNAGFTSLLLANARAVTFKTGSRSRKW